MFRKGPVRLEHGLHGLCSFGLSHQSWHQGAHAGGAYELLDLDCENLGGSHLFVEKLHNARQLSRNAVCDEEQTDAPRPEIGFDCPPKGFCVDTFQEFSQMRIGLEPSAGRCLTVGLDDSVDGPIGFRYDPTQSRWR